MTEGTAPRTRRTAPREERWRQLIDPAIVSIAQHGLSGTTTAIVTERAGLAAGIVGLHFGSNENLLVATPEHLAPEHRARWIEAVGEPGLTPAERLRAIIEAHFDPAICTAPKIATWFAFFGEAPSRDLPPQRRIARFRADRGGRGVLPEPPRRMRGCPHRSRAARADDREFRRRALARPPALSRSPHARSGDGTDAGHAEGPFRRPVRSGRRSRARWQAGMTPRCP